MSGRGTAVDEMEPSSQLIRRQPPRLESRVKRRLPQNGPLWEELDSRAPQQAGETAFSSHFPRLPSLWHFQKPPPPPMCTEASYDNQSDFRREKNQSATWPKKNSAPGGPKRGVRRQNPKKIILKKTSQPPLGGWGGERHSETPVVICVHLLFQAK